ncbi:MAG: TatD family hydrolase [Chlamydiota bacterium]
MFFDSHAHLTCDSVYNDLPGILERATAVQVDRMVNICTDKVTLERGLTLAEKDRRVVNAGATTPHDVEKEGGLYFSLFELAAKQKKLVAVGETGLDYHYKHSPIVIQQAFLRRYLALALECELPAIFHCRDAFSDLFSITDTDYKIDNKHGRALMHCFTGTMSEAEQALNRGWMISFSGIITFKRSVELREVVKETPLVQLLIETDTPYLAPQKQRGKQNEPGFIRETAQLVADVKGISLSEVAAATTRNAEKFFQC